MSTGGVIITIIFLLVLAGVLAFFVVSGTSMCVWCGSSAVKGDSRAHVRGAHLIGTKNAPKMHTTESLKKVGIDAVLVISLDNSKRWKEQVEPQMRKGGFGDNQYEKRRGVNGWSLSRQDLSDVLTPHAFYKLHCSEQIEKHKHTEGVFSRGAVGCALSHIAIWNYVAQTPDVKAVLVFEDDVAFPNDKSDVPAKIAAVVAEAGGVDNFDMLRMEGSQSPHSDQMCSRMDKTHTPVLNRCRGMYYGFGAYIVTKRGAQTLLRYAFPIETHIDNLPSFVDALLKSEDGKNDFICYAVANEHRFVQQNRTLPSYIRHTQT